MTELATKHVKDISYRLLKFYVMDEDEYQYGLELLTVESVQIFKSYNSHENSKYLTFYENLKEIFILFASGFYY